MPVPAPATLTTSYFTPGACRSNRSDFGGTTPRSLQVTVGNAIQLVVCVPTCRAV